MSVVDSVKRDFTLMAILLIPVAVAINEVTAAGVNDLSAALARTNAARTALTARLLEGVRGLEGVAVIGPDSTEMRGSAVRRRYEPKRASASSMRSSGSGAAAASSANVRRTR